MSDIEEKIESYLNDDFYDLDLEGKIEEINDILNAYGSIIEKYKKEEEEFNEFKDDLNEFLNEIHKSICKINEKIMNNDLILYTMNDKISLSDNEEINSFLLRIIKFIKNNVMYYDPVYYSCEKDEICLRYEGWDFEELIFKKNEKGWTLHSMSKSSLNGISNSKTIIESDKIKYYRGRYGDEKLKSEHDVNYYPELNDDFFEEIKKFICL